MIEPTRDNIYELLTSLCDRELDTPDAERLERYLSCHPELVQWLTDQRKLTEAAARVVMGASPAAPPELRNRILQRGAGRAGDSASPRTKPRSGRSAWQFSTRVRQPLAAIVLVAIGILTGKYLLRSRSPLPSPSQVSMASSVVPGAVIAQVSFIHADCARLPDAQHTDAFPEGALATAMRQDLETKSPVPDLSSIGFQFIGAGPCGRPLEGAVHLLYRPTNRRSRAAVSIFVQGFNGQYRMAVGKLYSLTTPQSPFPILAWRTETVAYFLVADDERTERQALEIIRGAPKP